MNKTVLITGATDGIGLSASKRFLEKGHKVILHGRNKEKLARIKLELEHENSQYAIDTIMADLSDLQAVKAMIEILTNKYKTIDVLVNNAGVYMTDRSVTADDLELRFAVNTIAPYLLTKGLLPLMHKEGRVINLSSAAQAPVDLEVLRSGRKIPDGEAYAQSKLALTMWSMDLAASLEDKPNSPSIIAINPKSFLGSKMVHEAYGTRGHDINIGGDIIFRASLSEAFKNASGQYYDNDIEDFSTPHPDALDIHKRRAVVLAIEETIRK